MKKLTKILPFILIAPVLVGCGKNVKSPKFADLGNKLEAAAWTEAAQKVILDSSLSKEDFLPSHVLKMERKQRVQQKTVFNKKTIFQYDDFLSASSNAKYDADNVLMSGSYQDETKFNIKDKHGKETENSKSKDTFNYQQTRVDDKDYVVYASNKFKEYNPVGEISEDNSAKKILDGEVKSTIYSGLTDSLSYYYDEYDSGSDEQKKLYSFYQNGNVFTIVYDYHSGVVEFTVGGKVIAKSQENTKIIIQADFTEGKFKSVYYLESTDVYDYLEDYQSNGRFYPKGSHFERKDNSSEVSTAVAKSVKVKAVKLDKYAKIGFPY